MNLELRSCCSFPRDGGLAGSRDYVNLFDAHHVDQRMHQRRKFYSSAILYNHFRTNHIVPANFRLDHIAKQPSQYPLSQDIPLEPRQSSFLWSAAIIGRSFSPSDIKDTQASSRVHSVEPPQIDRTLTAPLSNLVLTTRPEAF